LSRNVLVILVVAAISGWINGNEHAVSDVYATEWVRTIDGWESRVMVESYDPPSPPAVHPFVIAGLQLLASLFFLAAFPARVSVVRQKAGAPALRTHLKPSPRVAAVG
jgi:hypothetical protein